MFVLQECHFCRGIKRNKYGRKVQNRMENTTKVIMVIITIRWLYLFVTVRFLFYRLFGISFPFPFFFFLFILAICRELLDNWQNDHSPGNYVSLPITSPTQRRLVFQELPKRFLFSLASLRSNLALSPAMKSYNAIGIPVSMWKQSISMAFEI